MEWTHSSLSFVQVPWWSIGYGITISLLLLSQLQKTKKNSTQANQIHHISTNAATNSIHVFFIRNSLFCLSFNFLNFSRNWASDFLKFFLTFTEINWLEWYTLSLIILYTWIWIPSLTFWMQQRRNIDFWSIKTFKFGIWASWFSCDFLKILRIWASFSYILFSYKKTCIEMQYLAYAYKCLSFHKQKLGS